MNRIVGRPFLFKKFPHLKSIKNAAYLTISSTDPSQFGKQDVGKLYSVPFRHFNDLYFHKLYLPRNFQKQIHTLRDFVWMFRKQTYEVFNCIQSLESGQTAPRLVIWGKFGTGKSITLYQLIHLAYTQEYVLLTIPDAMVWSCDNYYEVQISAFKKGRLNSPRWAKKILGTFKLQNQHVWKKLGELKTTKKYVWSQVESTEEGMPITEIVETGLSAPFLATDCVGALGKELRIHTTAGKIKLLVAMDKANGLYGKTLVKRPDRTTADPDELALTIHMRKFLLPIWSNGLCALVADKAGISDCRNKLAVPVDDPRSLFGEKGFEQIEPFISVKTSLYSWDEANTLIDYYSEKNWIHQEEGPGGEEARKHLIHLSALNPAYIERICALSWRMDSVPPSQFNI